MPFDGIYLKSVCDEIKLHIGERIDRIYQPSKEEVIFALRKKNGSSKLLISTHADFARIHFTNKAPANPKAPPMFCMLLRKYLTGAKLSSVTQWGLDRIVFLEFETFNLIGDFVKLSVAVEIMGRHSNMILFDSDKRIIDAIKRVSEQKSSLRPIMPGEIYSLPPHHEKQNLMQKNADDFDSFDMNELSEKEKSEKILQTYEGISPLLAREIAFCSAPQKALTSLKNRLLTSDYQFTALLDQRKPRDFACIPILQYGDVFETKVFGSASMLLDFFYYEKDRQIRIKQLSGNLFKILDTASAREEKKLQIRTDELHKAVSRDEYRIYGDLIMAYLSDIKKGDIQFAVQDFYHLNRDVIIPLNPKKTPIQNAQYYYQEYKKAIRAENQLKALRKESQDKLIYLESVKDALQRSETIEEIKEIRKELMEEGVIKKQVSEKKKEKPLPAYRFCSSDGFTILCGRNNRQNDELTCKQAKKGDLWCHTQKIHGAHVIVVSKGKEVPYTTVQEACEIAAYHSKGRFSARVPVDYTQVKNVKKPANAKPGMVTYINQKTFYVTPNEEKIRDLKIN